MQCINAGSSRSEVDNRDKKPKVRREMKEAPAMRNRLERSPVVNQSEGYDYSVKLEGTRSGCEIDVTRPIETNGNDGCPSKHPLYVR